MNSFAPNIQEINADGTVTEVPGGGTSTFINNGNALGGFEITSFGG